MRVAPEHPRGAKVMCMKTHKLYKPHDLTEKEREYLAKQERREMMAALIMIILAAIIVTCLIRAAIGVGAV